MEPAAIRPRWQSIADDLLATTGLTLFLLFHPGIDEWWDVDVFLDEHPVGSFGRHFPTGESEFMVALADYLCEFTLDEELWGGWPICPDHGTHPLQAIVDENQAAIWRCPGWSCDCSSWRPAAIARREVHPRTLPISTRLAHGAAAVMPGANPTEGLQFGAPFVTGEQKRHGFRD